MAASRGDSQLRLAAERFRSQLLTGPPARDPVAVTQRLLAIQAQDPRGARLAIRARSMGGSSADVDRALTEDRSLVVSWLNRGTLHLVCSEDYRWLHRLTTPQLVTGNDRRLTQEGVTLRAADHAVTVVTRVLAREGPLTRHQLRERLNTAGIATPGQALVHIMVRATVQGLVVRGPMRGRQHAFVLAADWLPQAPPPGRDRALAELARRYLDGHGPASDRDLARWAGISLGDARSALRSTSASLHERSDGLVSLRQRPNRLEFPPPRLLGAFEPSLMGWTSRFPILADHDADVVSGGVFRPFVLVRGRGVGIWRLTDGGPAISTWEPIDADAEQRLRDDAEDVVAYLAPPQRSTSRA